MGKYTIKHPQGEFTINYKEDQVKWNKFKRDYSVKLLDYNPNKDGGLHYFSITFTEKKTGITDNFSWIDEYLSAPEPYYGHFNNHSYRDDDFEDNIKYLTYTKIKDFSKPITSDKMSVTEQNKLDTFINSI